MAETKYGHLVKKLSFRPGRGGANARELVAVTGDKMAGFDFNFIIGVYNQTGDWAPGRGAHTHPFDEFLLFFGYDDEDLSYLGSDMELSLGKEWEPHAFSVPTVAVAAKGFPHCPLVTKKVYKPFGHFHLALSAKYSGNQSPKEGTTNGNKYSHLVKKMEVKEGPGGANAKQLITMSGDDLEGLDINYALGLYNATGEWNPGQGAHKHPYNECYIFFGHDVDNLSYFGAELTIAIGEEHEKHVIDAPTVVSLPAGLPHFPIVCNKVERPYGMMQVGLARKYESTPVD